MEMKPITISFKNTPEEIELYKIIEMHTSKGAFIKDTLINALIKKNNAPVIKTEAKNDEINDIFESL
jgi:hypothetical protein